MTPEVEAKIMADTAAAWRQTNIAVILSEMRRYGLTIDDLSQAVHGDWPNLLYDDATGEFIWKRGARRGRIAGYIHADGYRYIYCGADKVVAGRSRTLPAHRMVWKLKTGSWPKFNIDHLDGNPLNNRFENLRDVPQVTNLENKRAAHVNNKLGVLGVTLRRGVYYAHIRAGGKKMQIGKFSTPDAAHAAYIEAKRKLHAGCTI